MGLSVSRSRSAGFGGTGGIGRGNAPPAEAPEGPTGTNRKQMKGANHQGQIIGSFMVNGLPPKGDASIELQGAIRSASRMAEQSIEQEHIPADLKEIPLRYFERLEGEE